MDELAKLWLFTSKGIDDELAIVLRPGPNTRKLPTMSKVRGTGTGKVPSRYEVTPSPEGSGFRIMCQLHSLQAATERLPAGAAVFVRVSIDLLSLDACRNLEWAELVVGPRPASVQFWPGTKLRSAIARQQVALGQTPALPVRLQAAIACENRALTHQHLFLALQFKPSSDPYELTVPTVEIIG